MYNTRCKPSGERECAGDEDGWKQTVREPSKILKLENTLQFGLSVTTKPSKQRQGLNLYGWFIQMAGDLRRRRVHTLTDHLVCFFQAKVFIAGNKQAR